MTRDEFLAYRADGLTYKEIGQKIGWTKDKVSGWARRHGLSDPNNNPKRPKGSGKPSEHVLNGAKGRRDPITEPKRVPGYLPRLFAWRVHSGARFAKCQWISGEPSASDSCKCLAPTDGVGPYCAEHEDMSR